MNLGLSRPLLRALGVVSCLGSAACGHHEDPLLPDAPAVDAVFDAPLEPAMVRLDPITAGFGTVVAGESSTPVVVTITNVGQRATGEISAATTTSSFRIDASTCGVLVPSATCTISVVFTPADTGMKTGALELTAAPGGTVSCLLDGTGIAAGELTVTPSTSSFGVVEVGQISPQSTFIVTNTGDGATGALTTMLGGVNPSEFMLTANTCSAALAGGDSCLIGVRFVPDFGGSKSATISVIGLPGGTVTVAMTGTASAPAEVVVTPQTHDFGDVLVSAASATTEFTATNIGGMTAGALTQSVSGGYPGQFTILSSTCDGAVLAPSGSCKVAVQFTPTQLGVKDAQINLWPGGLIHFHVTGTGVATAVLDD